jgi:DNA-binding NarL/FixJ family response regulator
MLSSVAHLEFQLVKRVLIIDSHPLMREAIRMVVLGLWPKTHTIEVGEFAAIDNGCRFGATIDLVVMDPALPGASGLSALVMVQQRLPHTPVVVFASRGDDLLVGSCNALGASAFVHKSAGLVEMTETLRDVAGGERVFPALKGAASASQELAALRKRLDGLTTTQMKVLLNIADGRLNKQVAADFQVTEAAIKAHLTVIFRKLGVHNRSQAMLALRPLLTVTDQPSALAA